VKLVMTSTDPACTPVDPATSCCTARVAAKLNSWLSVAYGDGLWVAVAGNGTNRVMTSGATFVQAQTAAPSPPSVSCAPSPLVADASVTCTVTGGDAGIDILWRAAYNPVFAEAGVKLDADGTGTFAFTAPAAALGQELTVELVEWLAPLSLGVVGGPVPTSVPSGGGPVPVWSLVLLALAGGLVLRRKSTVGVRG
jgi:MYXO-CTERM domain-containing protein